MVHVPESSSAALVCFEGDVWEDLMQQRARYIWVRKGLESPKKAQCQEEASVPRERLDCRFLAFLGTSN